MLLSRTKFSDYWWIFSHL